MVLIKVILLMFKKSTIYAIVPAYNESLAISKVVSGLNELCDEDGGQLIDKVLVVDNGSNDGTATIAELAGAWVVHESRRGYGYACMAGIKESVGADILLFVDGDHSVVLSDTKLLLSALEEGIDLVIGHRVLIEPGAMTFAQQFGNALACFISRLIWGVNMSDLGPFRAISRETLLSLDMEDMTYGWTIEMQLKAFHQGLSVKEVPVALQSRIGESKISGTLCGVIGAGIGIFSMIAKLWIRERRRTNLIGKSLTRS